MRTEHLRAILWMRWCILRNRLRRRSELGNAVLGILMVLALLVSAAAFVMALLIGIEELPEASPQGLMLVWIGLALGFLFFWTIGLVTDLQRSDSMSFRNLLHLPVSLGWVFLYNYLGSFVSFSIALFLPAMLGLALAMVVVQGTPMLLALHLLLGFFVMVTALTYQLRGWLARLMENKRRGRSIVAIVTIAFVLLMQVPNLINMRVARQNRDERRAERQVEHALRDRVRRGGADGAAAQAELDRRRAEDDREDQDLVQGITLAAMVLPPGWLPYGVRATFEGRWHVGLLGALGMLAIGLGSLRLSYRSTMRGLMLAGGPARRRAAARPRSATVARAASQVPAGKPLLVERHLPLVGERVSAIALACLRSLLRAPEAKLLMLTPVILVLVFWMLLSNRSALGVEGLAPSMTFGAIALGMVSVVPLVQNVFALDRSGFRAFVLSPAPRGEILLGKNLAHAPIALAIGLVALIALQVLVGGDLFHLVGALFQLASATLLTSLVGNLLSILNPMRLREGTLKAANASFLTVLWHLLALVMIPLTLFPLAVPGLLETFLPSVMRPGLFPVLHALGFALVLLLYRWMLPRQGALLQQHEKRILEVITRD